MTFIDVQLSRKVSVGFQGGPAWNTLVVSMANGKNRRRQEWAMPHHRYTADYTLLDPVAQNDVLEAFMATRGALHSFRFRDWNDYTGTAEPMDVGDGTATPRQLTKSYTFGSSTYTRDITLPVAGTLVVTSNGTPIAVTVNALTGMVTPTGTWPSGAVIKATFEFDVRVRFGADFYPFTRNTNVSAEVSMDLVEDFAA